MAVLDIAPDGTEFEATMSALVCTVTEPPPVGVLPIVKPDNVTVTATLAASVAVLLVMVMTMDVAPGAAADRVALPDTAADGVALVEKKPDGKFNVMVPPAASAPPAVGVNTKVAATLD